MDPTDHHAPGRKRVPSAPCLVDPWGGLAHFDGLTIRTDPLGSARTDRVIPCILDEQIFFCRLLRHLLADDAQGKTAINIGCGSGVSAIYAATMGMTVTATDTCSRSIRYSHYNWEQNRLNWPDSPEPTIRESNDLGYRDFVSTSFDFVLLNPPFNPTAKLHSGAQNADGGPDGQKRFLEQVKISSGLLKEGGTCFAIHLLKCEYTGKPHREIQEAILSHETWSTVTIYPAIQEPIRADVLIRKQYTGYTECEPNASESDDYYTIAVIELQKGAATRDLGITVENSATYPEAAPPCTWTWDDRIAIQKIFQERASSPGRGPQSPDVARFPAGALLVNHSFHHSGHDGTQAHSRPSAIVAAMNSWLQSMGALERDSRQDHPAFQALMIEAAPWGIADNPLKLSTETTLWSTAGEAKTVSALDAIIKKIKTFNERDRAIFNHPDFLHNPTSTIWNDAHELALSINSGHSSENGGEGDQILPLSFDSVVTPIKKFSIELENNAKEGSFASCLEQALTDFSRIIAKKGLLGKAESATCYYIGVPLPWLKPPGAAGRLNGTVYVYAWSKGSWDPGAEAVLRDIARTAAAYYDTEYTESAKREIAALASRSLAHVASHETRTFIDQLLPVNEPTHEYQEWSLGFLKLMLLADPKNQYLEQWTAAPSHALAEYIRYAYIMDKIGRDAIPRKLNRSKIEQYQREAAEGFPDTQFCNLHDQLKLIELKDGRIPMLLKVALSAAMRNALKHSDKDDFSFRIDDQHPSYILLVIENRYLSSQTATEDQVKYLAKYGGDSVSGERGTRGVLADLAREMFGYGPMDEEDYLHRDNSTSGEQSTTGHIQHVWLSQIPLPRVRASK